MKKKIIIAVIAITVIISAFAICSSAYEREDYYGQTLTSGTTIVFKDTGIIVPDQEYIQYSLLFTSGGEDMQAIKLGYSSGLKIAYIVNGTGNVRSAWQSPNWIYQPYRTIVLNQDYTLGNNVLSNFIIDNAESGLPEPPPPPDENIGNVLDNAKATFNTSLNVTSVIIAWLMANTLALCGLYLYILVALIGIAVRFFKK